MEGFGTKSLVAVTNECGIGRVRRRDADATRHRIGDILGVSLWYLVALVKFCGFPRIKTTSADWGKKGLRLYSVKNTMEWLDSQERLVHAGKYPVMTVSAVYRMYVHCRKEGSIVSPVKMRRDAWRKIVEAGIADDALKNMNYWRKSGTKEITAAMCAEGRVNGDRMLQSAREALIDRERAAALSDSDGRTPMLFMAATEWALSAVDAAGLAFDVGDEPEEFGENLNIIC